MKALVLAAGFGKRLKSFTTNTPKALIKVADIPLIFYSLYNLKKAGICDVIINLHYMPDQIKNVLKDGSSFNMNLTYSYEPQILGTGGAIKNVEKYFEFENDFIITNSDIVSNIDFKKFMRAHRSEPTDATLGVKRGVKKDLYFDKQKNLVSISKETPNLDWGVFTGVQIVTPDIFNHTSLRFSSSIEAFKKYIVLEKNIKVFPFDDFFWWDLGVFETILELENEILMKHYDFVDEIKNEMKLV